MSEMSIPRMLTRMRKGGKGETCGQGGRKERNIRSGNTGLCDSPRHTTTSMDVCYEVALLSVRRLILSRIQLD